MLQESDFSYKFDFCYKAGNIFKLLRYTVTLMDKHSFLNETLLTKKGLLYRVILDTCREGETTGVIYQSLISLRLKTSYGNVIRMINKLTKYGFLKSEHHPGYNKYYLTISGRNALLAVPVKSNPWMEQLKAITGGNE